MADQKRVLIVYAHQEPKSFNGALKDVAIETLKGQGHLVDVSDLYEMKFDPSASKSAFKDIENKDMFNFQSELKHAARTNTLPELVRAEIDKVVAADLIILQFPMYWLGMPAILKGWIDWCFAENVAFNTTEQRWYDNGPFMKKKVMLSITVGGTESFFSQRGVFGDMGVLLWPIHHALRLPGFQILAPHITHGPADVLHDQRVAMLQTWRDRLKMIWQEDKLDFIHIKHFDPSLGFQLTDTFVDSVKDKDTGPTVGQNLGKPLPPLKSYKPA